MKNTLYKITYELIETMELVFDNNGELTPELESQLNNIETMLTEKTDNIVGWVEYQEDVLRLITEKIGDLNELKKKISSRMKKFDEYVEGCLIASGKDQLIGDTKKIKVNKRRDVVNIYDEKLIPFEYLTTKTETSVNKKEIMDALKKGIEVSGATITKSPNCSIKYGWK